MFDLIANAVTPSVLLVGLNGLEHLPLNVATTVVYRRQRMMQLLVQLQLPSTQWTFLMSLGMRSEVTIVSCC
jgi:hypothetical protein